MKGVDPAAQDREPVLHVRLVVALDAPKIDALKLAQAEEKLFVQRVPGSDGLDLLARGKPALDARHVTPGIVDVGPARGAVERMRPGAKSEIRLAPPVFQVVERAAAGQRQVRDLVMLVTRG